MFQSISGIASYWKIVGEFGLLLQVEAFLLISSFGESYYPVGDGFDIRDFIHVWGSPIPGVTGQQWSFLVNEKFCCTSELLY